MGWYFPKDSIYGNQVLFVFKVPFFVHVKKFSKQLRLLGRGSLGLVLLVQGLSKHIRASPIDTNSAVQVKMNATLLNDGTVL